MICVERLLGMLRDFHASEENRSPEFATILKAELDGNFCRLAQGGTKISQKDFLDFLPVRLQSFPLPDFECVDERTFGILLTALATLSGEN